MTPIAFTITLASATTAGDPAAATSTIEQWTLWSAQAVTLLSWVGMFIIGFGALICIYRIVMGPHLADRAIGADTLSTYLIGLVLLLTLALGNLIFFDGVLVLALLGFAGTVAMAQYLARQKQSPPVSEEPRP